MQTHNLVRKTENKKARQVGRGGTRGKTSGRGTKGQNARAGRKKRPELRDFIKRIPKLRGRGKNINQSFYPSYTVVSLSTIEHFFAAGEKVTPATLVAKKVLTVHKAKNPMVKILASGSLTKKVTIADCAVTAAAKVAIEKAGGSVK